MSSNALPAPEISSADSSAIRLIHAPAEGLLEDCPAGVNSGELGGVTILVYSGMGVVLTAASQARLQKSLIVME